MSYLLAPRLLIVIVILILIDAECRSITIKITITIKSRRPCVTAALDVSRKADRASWSRLLRRRTAHVYRLRPRQLSQPARREFLLDLALVALEQLLQRLRRRVRQRLQQQVGLRLVLQDAGQTLHLLLEILPVRLAIGGQSRLVGDGERGRRGEGEIRRSGSPRPPLSPSPRPPVRRLQ